MTGVTLDSRAVVPGDVYAALRGASSDGADFAGQAVDAGAVAVIADRGLPVAVPVLVTAQPRQRLGDLAAWLYGDPSQRLPVLGVTGTNGKTTTAYLLEAGLAAAGGPTGLIGTVETHVAGEVVPAARTTPEAPELQALLAVMVERGVRGVAMEVSSHALALGRVDATVFAAAAFTNLSQDHLDFHGTLEAYFRAKTSLFDPVRCRHAVVVVDDSYGERLAAGLRHRAEVALTTVSLRSGAADWSAAELRLDAAGTWLRAAGPRQQGVDLQVRLPGAFNAANALTALATLVAAGIDVDTAAGGISALQRVPGRMEVVPVDHPVTAVVDYAHTPDAVARLLAALRPVTPGRLVVVLGCGGDRDRGKRPLMARAAADGADRAVFTSDNPRSEEPEAILAQMTAGLAPGNWEVVVDREAAVQRAVAGLSLGDTVVVAGKGHERSQEFADHVVEMDDRELLLAALGGPAGEAPWTR